ncbi:hypothetical protein [Neobacillus niacini]|uniref:hypothetical protein n=1 Tax=Neobacillus niacini TaxID=86668 RepID=UPI00286BFCBD|nr:hypothetical protein [Neobacillus niacini]
MSNVVQCDPKSVVIGMEVEVVFEDWSKEISIPKFRPKHNKKNNEVNKTVVCLICEIERVINTHHKALDSAAIGVPSEISENEVLAVVILREGEKLNPEELLDF